MTPARGRIGVVVNPARAELADELLAQLASRDADVVVERPEEPGDIDAAIDRVLQSGVTIVAGVGGDGTQRAVAARLADTDVAMAVVPGGTVNLLAQVTGTGELDAAVDAMSGGARRVIDVGRADGFDFVLNASTGWDAAVIERVDDGAKRLGRFGFVVAAIAEWRRRPPRRTTVRIDGADWFDGPAMTVVVMNAGQRGSASWHLAPDAELDDGLLDVVVLPGRSVGAVARTAWAVLRGNAPPVPAVRTAQAMDIEVSWATDVPSQVDGDERAHVRTIRYACRPSCLSIAIPPAGPDRPTP